MPRRRMVRRKKLAADPIYNNPVVAAFVGRLTLRGKRSVAAGIFYTALEDIRKKADKDPIEVFLKAIENVKPVVEVKSRRVGGATYQVPVEIRDERREALGMRWLIQYARGRNGSDMSRALSAELLDAYNSTGAAFKEKEDTHRMAEANKAFAHYRW